MKKTEWFPPSVKPVRVGLYERRMIDVAARLRMSPWAGDVWLFGENLSGWQDEGFEWRGLAEEPK